MFTLESVINELRHEAKTMSGNFQLTAGDINYREEGGVTTKKNKDGTIEFIVYFPIARKVSDHTR